MPHLLIVDDNPINLKLACEVLEASGFVVSRAADSEQALDLLGRESFDLILMDLAMPGVDGFTLTRRLKRDERLKHIPIVALTASAMKGDDRKALDAGCCGYITKPIDTRRIADQVSSFLPRSSRDRP